MAIDENKEDAVQLIGFHVRSKFFGADILTVQEILRDPLLEQADDAPAFIAGFIELRGQRIPVVDLKQRLGGGDTPTAQRQFWVLLTRVENITLGFIADDVTRIYKMSLDSILPAPEIILSGLPSQYIKGVCELEVGMLVVLDLKRLIAGDDITALKKMNLR